MIDFMADAHAPCRRCRAPGAKARDVVIVDARPRRPGFTLTMFFCDACQAAIETVETIDRAHATFHALIDGGLSAAAAVGQMHRKLVAELTSAPLA